MSMSKKDYNKFAEMLKEFSEQIREDEDMSPIEVLDGVTVGIANILAEDNYAFDRQRFYKECGLIKGF